MLESYEKMGRNVITPKVIKWERVGNRIIELSKGTGMDGAEVFGVTELEYADAVLSTTRRGSMFTTRKEANARYSELVSEA